MRNGGPATPRRAPPPLVLLLIIAAASTCVTVPRSGRSAARKADYFAVRRELAPSIVDAIERGHVLPGMDAEQVWVVLGDPIRKTRFTNSDAAIEVWLYPGHRLHQDQLHAHGNSMFRIVLVDGRVRIVEPL